MAEAILLTCGWCRTPIASEDEVQHHFLVAHGERVSQSVRYHYPERIADDLAHLLAAAAVSGSRGDEQNGEPT